MKLIDGDKLERHLDYLIGKDNQFAKMCDGDDDFSRQRKYCFEVDALAYQLCKSVMDYYLVKDMQPVKQGKWICEFYNDVFDVYQADCSVCKRESTNKYDKVSESYECCPHCGARMDGAE